jgi:hypothetical protein
MGSGSSSPSSSVSVDERRSIRGLPASIVSRLISVSLYPGVTLLNGFCAEENATFEGGERDINSCSSGVISSRSFLIRRVEVVVAILRECSDAEEDAGS